MSELSEGKVIAGRFRLERELGRGGMGSVWRAQHIGLDVPCAVKFILGGSTEARARFEREAKAAAMLRSPNVVQILDHGVCDGMPYIAMELLEGEELQHRLDRLGRLSPQETVDVLWQVGRALGKAHQVGLVHRDLKPANIFLVRDEEREIAKVLDFGIAKSTSMDLAGGAETKTGALLGTPFYMSPEQAQGAKNVDHRADLWSVAVIAFRCLTGHLPFNGESLLELLTKIVGGALPMPTTVAPDLPATVDAWWARAAARSVAERFGTAQELVEALAVSLHASLPGRLSATAPPPLSSGAVSAATPPLAPHDPASLGNAPTLPRDALQAGASVGSGISKTFGGSTRPKRSWVAPAAAGVVAVVVGSAAAAYVTTYRSADPVVAAPPEDNAPVPGEGPPALAPSASPPPTATPSATPVVVEPPSSAAASASAAAKAPTKLGRDGKPTPSAAPNVTPAPPTPSAAPQAPPPTPPVKPPAKPGDDLGF